MFVTGLGSCLWYTWSCVVCVRIAMPSILSYWRRSSHLFVVLDDLHANSYVCGMLGASACQLLDRVPLVCGLLKVGPDRFRVHHPCADVLRCVAFTPR